MDFERDLEHVISTATTISEVNILAGSTTDHLQLGLYVEESETEAGIEGGGAPDGEVGAATEAPRPVVTRLQKMGKAGDDLSELVPWGTVVLMEVTGGFAFFEVATTIFRMPVNMIWAHFTNPQATHRAVVACLDYVRCGDKTALWCSSRRGGRESFVDLVKEYSSKEPRFIVEDEELRDRIKSNLGIDSINDEEDAVREVAWGIRNALPFIISEYLYKITISPQRHLPLCQGFQVLMKKYQIEIPTEAVDQDFLTSAGALQRLDELMWCRCANMRKVCAKLVPGISGMIKDNFRYVEVMAKILAPWLVGEEGGSSKWSTAGEPWFTPDEMQKIVAKDAAADDARKTVKGDPKLAAMIKGNLHDYRRLSKSHDNILKGIRTYAANAKRGQKRSHTEMAEQEVVEAAAE